ncbi:MAG: GLPGLI family protein [Prevotellaceae bacterium]|jgi:GLPGLI family protein|nr:GLPGLI family protein [Prevotellaceae bacterium]
MKAKILIAATVCACLFNQAKSQTIQVIYETQPKMQIKADGLDAHLIEQIKKSSKIKNMLCYSNGESVFKSLKNENEPSGGINIKTPENIIYKNHNTNKEISYKDFFGKGFLIESELKIADSIWEITDSTKNILGYTCTKAISKNKEKEASVWFCPHLPIKDGPFYTGLDGLVLEVVSDNSTVSAQEILIDADCDIAAPTKGKKISKEEFDKMVEKRMKTMEQSDESGGGITIKIMR